MVSRPAPKAPSFVSLRIDLIPCTLVLIALGYYVPVVVVVEYTDSCLPFHFPIVLYKQLTLTTQTNVHGENQPRISNGNNQFVNDGLATAKHSSSTYGESDGRL